MKKIRKRRKLTGAEEQKKKNKKRSTNRMSWRWCGDFGDLARSRPTRLKNKIK